MNTTDSETKHHTLHPAISYLLRKRRRALLRRITRSFATRRRFALSMMALLLAAVWLGNAMLSILFREPLDPQSFRSNLPLGLFVYALWHFLKNAFKRPEVPIEWSPAEIELLVGRPFTRDDRLAYRFAMITNSVVVKAFCFSILMIPDLPYWLAGFVGISLGLLFIDLLKVLVETVAWGMSDRAYRFYRFGSAVWVAGFAVSALTITFCNSHLWQFGSLPAAIGFAKVFLVNAASLSDTFLGIVLETPFRFFTQVALASQFTYESVGAFGMSILLIASMIKIVRVADQECYNFRVAEEQRRYASPDFRRQNPNATTSTKASIPKVAMIGGVGPLVWRQIKGVNTYRSSLLFAISIPSILACMPALVYDNTNLILLNVVGALAFYSFVLLPTALKFDFRRDLDRLVIFKALPLSPLTIVAGQLATPVLVASLFQILVFAMVSCLHPLPIMFVVASVVLLIPLNVLIFAIENLIFLLFPYRVAQEGFAVFLRSTLTFTAKGIFFLVALITVVAWALGVGDLTVVINQSLSMQLDHRFVFAVGVWTSIFAAACLTVACVTQAFRRFDVAQDMPS